MVSGVKIVPISASSFQTKGLPLDRESPSLVVNEQQALFTQLFSQDGVLGPHLFNGSLLFTLQPIRQCEDEPMPGEQERLRRMTKTRVVAN